MNRKVRKVSVMGINGEIRHMQVGPDGYVVEDDGYHSYDHYRGRASATAAAPKIAAPKIATPKIAAPAFTWTGQTGGEIVRDEKRGIQNLTRMEQLPRDMVKADADLLTKLGFDVTVEDNGADKLFRAVRFPEGWTKKNDPQDHRTMFLLDPAGNSRGYVWYKAASYDRAAYGGVHRRYDINVRHFRETHEVIGYVLDERNRSNKRVVFQTSALKNPKPYMSDELQQEVRDACMAWAKKNLPEINSCEAYWDASELPEVGKFPAY